MTLTSRNESFRRNWATKFGTSDPKIVCVGLNYATHTGETGFQAPTAPLLFGKFANTIIGS